MLRVCLAVALPFVFLSAAQAQPQPQAAPANLAAAFGVRESIQSIALSPDGRTLAYVAPAPAGQGALLYTVALGGDMVPRIAARSDGVEQRLAGCDFVSARRLVCRIHAVRSLEGTLVPVSRLVALNADGSNMRVLGERDTFDQVAVRTWGGRILDFLPGDDDAVLMAQDFIPDERTGTRVGRRGEGLGVVRVDTATLASRTVEAPRPEVAGFVTDGRGMVRIQSTQAFNNSTGQSSNRVDFRYRRAGASNWEALSSYDTTARTGFYPVAVDPGLNVAYGFERLDGRDALYRISLDGSLRRELVASNADVDVDNLIRIGRRNRVVGVSYATERRQAIYFDAELNAIAEQLHRALPNLPLINFIDSTEDESQLLVWAGSDADPGRYYTYDRASRRLNEIMLVRPELEHVPLASVRPITYSAADGTRIPGYLTLPPGGPQRGLPAIVMPHGGPGARDEWGFDWLAQYFAHRGFAVLQPNFRGSSGYGDAWFQRNGFVSWRTAIGDINDGARWLVSEGIADRSKLAIFGWSYGGYAALQSNVLAPDLFRAVVAVAPVTDLAVARNEWEGFSNSRNVRDFFGTGPHIREGSPAQNAAAIRAPVLMFHGALDRNVGIRQARLMRDQLREAGRPVELIEYPQLDHQLQDSAARIQMLQRSDAFIRQALGIQ